MTLQGGNLKQRHEDIRKQKERLIASQCLSPLKGDADLLQVGAPKRRER